MPVWFGTFTLKETSYFWSLFNTLHLRSLIDPSMHADSKNALHFEYGYLP